MADQLVDPHRRLVAKGRGHRVLAVGAAGDRHLGAALGEIGHRRERIADQAEENAVRLAQHQQIAGLGDVLRRRPPMHPAAMRLADDAAEFPDQRHDRVAGAGKALVDAGAVEEFEMRRSAIASAAACGMMPSSACAPASAASTSSQACQRFSWL